MKASKFLQIVNDECLLIDEADDSSSTIEKQFSNLISEPRNPDKCLMLKHNITLPTAHVQLIIIEAINEWVDRENAKLAA